MLDPKRILVLAPHTDDAELGCGGSIAKWVEAGVEVSVAAFSTAEASLPEGSVAGRLAAECHAALDSLGIPEHRRHIYDFPVRELGYHRQEVLEILVQLGRDVATASDQRPGSSLAGCSRRFQPPQCRGHRPVDWLATA